jgi:hypothetical protein
MPYFYFLPMCSCQRTRRITVGDLSSNGLASVNYFNKNQVVGVTGFEPVTLRLSSACSNQLSYTPICWYSKLVELRRFELLTYSLQSYRSTN